ncbi:alpha/beta hydrolase [Streptomyces sp. NPDC002054]|uniref:alpha/beta hydrolase n=1 Tax=Streptomyces sp. NPDC002054 TaxID=3154663 RepID=UPI00331B8CEE
MRLKRLAPMLATAGLIATTVPLLATAQASAAEQAAAPYLKQKPAWHRCADNRPASFECATLKVPLDYRRPQGRMIDLAISRVKSENPGKRRGILMANPGGPGASGTYRAMLLHETMPKDVRDQYDLVGFDPRGVGGSSPISCGLTEDEEKTDRPYRPETYAADIAWARTVADKCRKKAGDVIPYITTRNTARDMDTIRAVLGERKVSYVGYSYGTYLGAVYSQMFPQRTDRFVLDSGVDPNRIWRGMFQVWATGTEPAYRQWTRWAAQRNDEYGLGTSPEAVSKTFWGLVERADRVPIDYFGTKLTGDDLRASREMFFHPNQASIIVKQLKKSAAGQSEPAPVPAGGAAAPEPKDLPTDNSIAVVWSVMCGDTGAWPRSTGQYAREAAADKKKYPLYGDVASNIKPCAFWDRPVEEATPMDKAAKVLTVQNEWDPQTPLSSGQGLHRALKGSRMVLAAGGRGHGVYLLDDTSCANATVNRYLSTGRLPAKDVTCQNPPAETSRRVAPNSSEQPLPVPFPFPFPFPFPGGSTRF